MNIDSNPYPAKEPRNNQKLYKFIPLEYFLDMIGEKYLFFNKVTNYNDLDDSKILPKDVAHAESSSFEKNPEYTWHKLCIQFRENTYSCCFSLSKNKKMWEEYGKNNAVCLVITYEELKKYFNSSYQNNEEIRDMNNNKILLKDFKFYFSLVDYVNRKNLELSRNELVNPLKYVFLKEKRNYSHEKELRIAIFSFGMKYVDRKNPRKLDALKFPFDLSKLLEHNIFEKLIIKKQYHEEIIKKFETAKLAIDQNKIVKYCGHEKIFCLQRWLSIIRAFLFRRDE